MSALRPKGTFVRAVTYVLRLGSSGLDFPPIPSDLKTRATTGSEETMGKIETEAPAAYRIELVLLVNGQIDQGVEILERINACAARLKCLAESVLAEEFGGAPTLVSADIGWTSIGPPRKVGRQLSAPAAPSKKDRILAMLGRTSGATMEELRAATGWGPGTVSGQLTYLAKLGHTIARERVDGALRYRLAERLAPR